MRVFSLIIAILTLLLTGLIPVFIYALGRKGEKITRALLFEQRRLLSAERLDALAGQAGEMSDPRDLGEILQEAKDLSNDRNFDRVVEAYWRNPMVPLCGSVVALDSRGVLITSQHLSAKLRGKSTWLAIRELREFILRSKKYGEGAFVASRVTDWLLSRFAEHDGAGDGQIRDLLEVAPDETFYALLEPLDDLHRSLPTAARVNILAGVCDAYLDRIGFFPKNEKPIEQAIAETTEKSRDNANVSALLASKLGSLLHRNRLRGLAEWDYGDDCTIPVECCAALVVAVTGAVSFCNEHSAMRALQNMSAMGINPASLAGFKYDYDFGRAKYAQYRPGLFHVYWPARPEGVS